jgi:hypothetical protein
MSKQRVPFKRVFELAQAQLKTVFGMEMVELPGRDKFTLKERRGECALSVTMIMSKPRSCTKGQRNLENIHFLDPHQYPLLRLPHTCHTSTSAHQFNLRRSSLYCTVHCHRRRHPTKPYKLDPRPQAHSLFEPHERRRKYAYG